ncbi:MAG TPA: amino acid adenylation domain-containing protein, partial [Thermoanaerobaculia bacterium]
GFRIELGEIEWVLRSYPGVREAVVLLRSSDGRGPQLVAYVAGDDPAAQEAGELRRFLAEKLPDYMVPSAFVALESLPLGPNGKIDRAALPAPPDLEVTGGASPQTSHEELLSGIWSSILGLPHVGIHDDFFGLGGHSLLATQMVSRMREVLGVEIPLRAIFEAPTIALLAERTEQALQAGRPMLPPIEPRQPGVDSLPLSFSQRRLWFLDQLQPESPAYNIPLALRIEGRLDATALAASLAEIVRRHESLRTTFRLEGGEPIQVISVPEAFDLWSVDLSVLSVDEREREAVRLAREESLRPFALSRGPLLRAAFIRMGDAEHVLLLTVHHVASDGWSMGILVRELGALYGAFSQGLPSTLPELPIQYADFALWQQRWMGGEALAAELRYWQRQLSALASLDLPLDHPRPSVLHQAGASRSFELAYGLCDRLGELARAEGVTFFMALLAAFQSLLYRSTGQVDIAVGTPIAGRTLLHTEGMIGIFINTLVLRTDFSAGRSGTSLSARELLARVRKTTLAAYTHQNLPFEKLVEELQPGRDLSRTPLVDVMIGLHNQPVGGATVEGLRLEPFFQESGVARFDLSWSFEQIGGSLRGGVVYRTALFDATTIQRMTGHLAHLLEGMLTAPGRDLGEIPLLSAGERQQLVAEWNDTRGSSPGEPSLARLFEAQVRRTPEAAALVFEGSSLSYSELNAGANRLAHHLRELGVGPEVRASLYMERCPERVLALLGILKAGGAFVPMEPEYPQERIAWMLEDSRAAVIITRREDAGTLPDSLVPVVRIEEDFSFYSSEEPCSGLAPQHPAYVLYTSGSTGLPKGVVVSHRAILNHMQWQQEIFPLGPGDTVLHKTPMSFDPSVCELFAPLWVGARLVLARPGGEKEPAYLVDQIRRHEVSALQVVPTLLRLLVAEPGLAHCRSLRRIYCGGELLPHELAEHLKQVWGGDLINVYGPTEAAIRTTFWKWQGDGRASRSVPLGRPITNAHVCLLDDRWQPVPVGIPGELYIGGAGLARGYSGRPELTAERFLPHPWGEEPGQRLYRSGDRARWLPEGTLEFLGRLDHQVKLRGVRIELGEIESVLRSHAEVQDAVVRLWEAPRRGPELVAYVVAAGGLTPETGELRRFLSTKLPDPMVPSVYVSLDRLPLTPNGKIDRAALPNPQQPDVMIGEAPRTSHEEILAGIWISILGLSHVGIHDDFFGLGGHSLLATQMVSRMREILRVEIPMRAIFEAPTIALLAERTERALQAGRPMLPPIEARQPGVDSLPLSFSQRRLWFLDQLQPESPAYNIPLALRIEGRLDATALAASLAEIVRRHESLRTTFHLQNSEPIQVISVPEAFDLWSVDLSVLSVDEREREAVRLAREESLRPFSLSRGPVLRAAFIRLGDAEHVLLLTVHHVVSDGWSMGILIRELGALYGAFSQGLPSTLPELPVQYADFALWQQRWMGGEALAAELRYWQRQLSALASLDLPLDRPRSPSAGQAGASCLFEWPGELADGLAELARREGVTRFMALLAAFQLLLYRYTSQLDVVVGTPIAGRNLLRTEDLIGFFINTLVLRTDLSVGRAGDPLSARQLLARVRETSLEAYAHQNLSFEKLVEVLQPERDLSRTPLFDVMFALHNQPVESSTVEGLRLEPFFQESGLAKFDLSWFFEETAGSVHGGVVYRTALFDATTIQRMTEHLAHLLEGMLTAPDRDLGEIPLLNAEERQQLLAEWNDTRGISPSEPSLARLFEAQVRQTPEAVAVVFEETTLSYDELNRRANRLARRLRKLGVGPEVPVAIAAERSLELVVGLLGILKAGGAYVPLDPSYPEKRLALMLEELMERAPESVLLTQKALPELSPASALVGSPRPILHRIFLDAEEEPAGDGNLAQGAGPDYLAYVIYTSGSTGKPKGVMNTHRGLLNRLSWAQQRFGLTGADRVLQKTPMSFDVSVWEFFWPLVAGAELVLAQPGGHRDSGYLAALIARRGITVLHFVPSMLEASLREPDLAGCGSLRAVIASGEALTPELARRFAERLGGSGVELHNLYGPTEAAIEVTAHRCEPAESQVPIGRPVANTRIHLLDRDHRPVPLGVSGELMIGGVQLARGYFRQPARTAESFIPDPLSGESGARLYRTGDLARYRSDGEIVFLGRIDHQIKLRGFRIELGEIEWVLRSYPGVREAVVLLRSSDGRGPQLVAYVAGDDPAA